MKYDLEQILSCVKNDDDWVRKFVIGSLFIIAQIILLIIPLLAIPLFPKAVLPLFIISSLLVVIIGCAVYGYGLQTAHDYINNPRTKLPQWSEFFSHAGVGFKALLGSILVYLPFFILGALAFIFPHLKALFTTPSRGCTLAAALAFVAYLLNQRYGSGDAWMYETESVITMVLGLWMVNVVFSFGHRLLNFQSARVTYFVNASLFIYLVHHPLTLFFGAYITPHITSNWLGFLCGLIFVVGIAIILYEIHLRIPLLKFLFSGKPVVKRENDKAPAR